ncbi:agmatinase [Segniliparus rugosus]|uniref:Agmatinase n=1 Tax=Segniliparus rugosus (strain ATCC BAA-974 / DSM 45345 / CCUG 50838 / CIP 108380 / JCM 13579 / CDC 945) TaxID=679197 RepID=E5XRM3_SEGRC|nr:agmatinase [Segniliparus rugosus]EFV12986.1 agmatinase [Segniliparus rugosus ATCC BAA-974]
MTDNADGPGEIRPDREILGPFDGFKRPRFTEPTTFARLPRLDQVERADIAILGVPFDGGTSYRPGARFGPGHVRASSKLIRQYHPPLGVYPFQNWQVADAGDLGIGPYSIVDALAVIEEAADELIGGGTTVLAIGGDHTIALPLLRSTVKKHGPVAVLHFDAHLDTWDSYFGADFTHGTPFRRASEEGLIDLTRSMHVGIRGSLAGHKDLEDDAVLGFQIIHTDDFQTGTVAQVVERMCKRLGGSDGAGGPVYVSIDVDVLDPAHAPGTGTPEAGGLTTRELQHALRGLVGLPVVGADVVEVAPAYDHAEITGIAAAHIVYELLALLTKNRFG